MTEDAAPRRKIGVLGGSFNPIHNGHLHLAQGFYEALGLDTVLLIPVFSPPHKSGRGMAAGALRLKMCGLACEGLPWLETSDIELARGGRSYTAETLEQLSSLYAGARLYLLMGADMFLTLDQWRDFDKIARLAALCCTQRRGDGCTRLEECARSLSLRYGAECIVEHLPPVELSSTQIRQKIADGESIEGLVPENVRAFIERKSLYKTL